VAQLYRVFNYLEGAAPDEPGGAFYIPPQVAGRIDNPEHYRVLYVASEPAAAVAEAFGPRPYYVWTKELLRGHPMLPGSVRALAACDIACARS